jgi:hypothetical protein
MVDDPVYQDFVSPFLREEGIRAEQAESRAEQAETLLLREQETSQRYAAQLRALGIDPETLQ